MIEKKISYEINVEKPSKTKPVKQGGVLNYLGKQKTVSAPVKWRSSKDHPIAHLAYITKDEEKILVDLDLYGSLKGKPNKGPSGIMSLNGGGGGGDGGGGDGGGGDGGGSSGGDSGGDSGDSGDAGDSGDSGDSGDAGDAGDSGTSSAASAADAGFGDSATGEGGGTADAGVSGTGQEGAQAAENTDMGPAGVADAETAEAESGITAAVNAVQNAINQTVQNAINNPVSTMVGMAFGPVAGLAARGIAAAVDAANRGVTAPNDFSQATESVQSGPAQSSGGDGGITTLVPTYAPLYNQATGDPLLDSLIARYRIDPAAFGIR